MWLPSIDFRRSHGLGIPIRVNAAVSDSKDSLFLYTVEDAQRGEVLGGIEWVGVGETDPDEFPTPDLLDIQPVRPTGHSSLFGTTDRRKVTSETIVSARPRGRRHVRMFENRNSGARLTT